MTKRIFRSICAAAIAVFAASALLFLLVLYNDFGETQKKELRTQTELVAHAVANEGMGYFKGLPATSCRITWIGADGAVLYDSLSDADAMENHLEREEIKEARERGLGESYRYSATLTERSLYCARLLPDGSALRLSVSQSTLLALVLEMAQPICLILLIALALSLALAMRLSKRIVEPLNHLDLEHPQENGEYEELAPLLRRLETQKRKIRRQRDELERKRREFEAVTENMTEGIVLLNAQGDVLEINRSAKRQFGAALPCIGRSLRDLSDSPQIAALLQSAAAGRHDERTADLADGRYQLILSPVEGKGLPSGQGSVLLVVSVTEKERTEQMRREFTANVSHELKTPLQSIAGSAELLANGLVREEDKLRFYERIQEEALRMTRLVEDILYLSHLDEGADGMERKETDLLSIAEDVARSLDGLARDAGVSLLVEGEPAVILGIPQLLRSIVLNLCDNAIKYNREGGSVSVSVRREGGNAILTVADTGIGIPTKLRERVFERFYRVDKSRSKELRGTGLGLSIVKHAAQIHHARIDLRGAPGEGTTVTVTFPAA